MRRFSTLLSMVSGLIASQHVSLGKIADNQPDKIYSLSQVKKNERWLDNGLIDSDTFFTPLIIKILHGIILQEKELIFVIDGSMVGRGCQTLIRTADAVRTAKDTLLTNQNQEVFQPKKLDVGKESCLYVPDCQLSSQVKPISFSGMKNLLKTLFVY